VLVRCLPRGLDESTWLRLAAAVEQRSEHPLARAVVKAARERGIVISEAAEFTSEPGSQGATSGRGVAARVEGRRVVVGNADFLRSWGVDPSASERSADALVEPGETPVFAAVDQADAGWAGIRDPLRPEAADVVRQLKNWGLGVELVTGDRSAAAAAIGRALGIETVTAQTLPPDKAAAVARRQTGERPHVVGMVGDGINDAPALAQADVGIALGGGTDVALAAADLTLSRNDLAALLSAIGLARRSLQVIRQNLFFAFVYNLAAVPVAAGALYPWTGLLFDPMLASTAMAASSVSVVTNSLRLRGFPGHAIPSRPSSPAPAASLPLVRLGTGSS
jgi:Cu+-exporting ATPase